VQATAELESLLEKPSLTAKELKRLVNLFSGLLDHPLTGSEMMIHEGGFCPFTGRVEMSLFIQGQEGEPDSLELACIISQPLSEGIKWVSEEARTEVRSLPQAVLYHEPH